MKKTVLALIVLLFYSTSLWSQSVPVSISLGGSQQAEYKVTITPYCPKPGLPPPPPPPVSVGPSSLNFNPDLFNISLSNYVYCVTVELVSGTPDVLSFSIFETTGSDPDQPKIFFEDPEGIFGFHAGTSAIQGILNKKAFLGVGDDNNLNHFTELEEQYPVINGPVETLMSVVGIEDSCDPCDEVCDAEARASGTVLAPAIVMPHSGQEYRQEIDLFIKGRDLAPGRSDAAVDFKIARQYTSRVLHTDSIFGKAWAFNYRQTFEENSKSGRVNMRSFGNKNTFAFNSKSTILDAWHGTRGRVAELNIKALTKMTMRGGTQLQFLTEGTFLNRKGIMNKIISPNTSNEMEFIYETAAQQPDIFKRKLLKIRGPMGRELDFIYGGDSDFPEGVSAIREGFGFANPREVTYDYDNQGLLRRVTSPAVTAPASLNNNFPTGKTTEYRYFVDDPVVLSRLVNFEDQMIQAHNFSYLGEGGVVVSVKSGTVFDQDTLENNNPFSTWPDVSGFPPKSADKYYAYHSFSGPLNGPQFIFVTPSSAPADNVRKIRAYVTGTGPVTMTAYKLNTTVVGSVSTSGANFVGHPDCLPPNQLLEFEVPKGETIHRVVFGAQNGTVFTVDDFSFDVDISKDSSPVPGLPPLPIPSKYDDLKCLLTGVVYPNQVAAGSELTALSWTYITDPGSPHFGWVDTHTVGNPSAPGELADGGTYRYEYQDLTGGCAYGPVNAPATGVTVTNPANTVSYLVFNRVGQMLSEKVFNHKRKQQAGSPTSYTRTVSYNTNGDVVQYTDALGIVTKYTHQDPGKFPRRSHLNVIRKEISRSAQPADQDITIREFKREPIYNRLFAETDPRGFEPGNVPADFTRYTLPDYAENLTGALTTFGNKLSLDHNFIQSLFDLSGLSTAPGVNTELNGDGKIQFCGNPIYSKEPTVALPALPGGIVFPLQTVIELRQYNDFGQLIRVEDAEENVHEYSYYGAHDPDGWGAIEFPSQSTTDGGYFKQRRSDTELGAGRNSGTNPPPVNQTVTIEYGPPATGFPGNSRGVWTKEADAINTEYIRWVNELDQVATKIDAFGAVYNSGSPGSTTYPSQENYIYDHNSNIVERQVINFHNPDGGQDTTVIYKYTHNILNGLKTETLDSGVGNLNIINKRKYDPRLLLEELTKGFGKPEETTDKWTYGDLAQLLTYTRALDGTASGEDATYEFFINPNGTVIKEVDADGDETLYNQDGFDRLKETVDRNGHREEKFYDSSNNVEEVKKFGPANGSDPTEVLLAHEKSTYDKRNRLVEFQELLTQYPNQPSIGVVNEGAWSTTSGFVRQTFSRDRLNRIVWDVDHDGDTTSTSYLGISNWISRVVDPENNDLEFTYDKNGNVLTEKLVERTNAPGIALVSDEIFMETYTYDPLNRLETIQEPNGQVSRCEYNSINELVKIVDALGNQMAFVRDNLGREIIRKTYLSANGVNASSINVDPNQGGGDGMIAVNIEYDDLHRAINQTNDNNNQKQYFYDKSSNLIRCLYADNTEESWVFNKDRELQTFTNQNGSVITYAHDAEGNPLSRITDNSSTTHPVGGSERETWEYDGLYRVTKSLNDNGSGEEVICQFVYNSLDQRLQEEQFIQFRPTLRVNSDYEAYRETGIAYPNRRKIIRSFDSLDRLSEVREGANNSLIFRQEYVGSRILKIKYGNRSEMSYLNNAKTQTHTGIEAGYDLNARPVKLSWSTAAGTPITSYFYEYNGLNGLGTNRMISEERAHLAQKDVFSARDSRYRIRNFDRNQVIQSDCDYDGVDRMTQFNDEGIQQNPVVDGDPVEAGLDQYSSFANQQRFYDANGNLIDDGNFKYVYDSQNRLVSISNQDTGEVVRYLYDASHRRVLKKFDFQGILGTFSQGPLASQAAHKEEEIRYVYDRWEVLEERDGRNSVLRQYVLGFELDRPVQLKDYTRVGEPIYYYHWGAMSAGALTDSNQRVVEFYTHKWKGEPIIIDSDKSTVLPESKVGNSYFYHGRRFDLESGKYYYRRRYYDPTAGEFISIDPMGLWYEDSIGNGYGAFDEDGRNLIDPYGESPFSILAKQIVKAGIKKGLRKFAENQVKKRLKKYMSKKQLKDFMKELEEILDTLDSTWWEWCLELPPVFGDLYGAGSLANKIRKAYDKLQDLENKYVDKISKSLKGKARDKFMKNMRKNGVKDARKDVDMKNKVTGSKDKHKGLEGHHRDNVANNPDRASDPRNIEFLDRPSHQNAHGGNFQNPTSSGGTNIYRN